MEQINIYFRLRQPMPGGFDLGFEGDNDVRRLAFYLPDVVDGQTATLIFGGEYANVITLEPANDAYVVDLTAEIIGVAGTIEGQIVINGPEGEVWQSAPIMLNVEKTLDISDALETRYPTAVEQMLTEIAENRVEMEEQIDRAEAAAERAEEAADRAESGGGGSGEPGAEGEDGGYYRPSVEDGVLSWTPSKDDMPSVPAADIRGPKGDPGTDATVTAESITSALGYTPVNPSDIPVVPVQSVNGKTGAVVLSATDVDALPSDTDIPTIDATLTQQGAAADAKAVGDAVGRLSEEMADQFADRYTKAETDTAIVEATKENEYELIETITVTEEITVIERTAKPDGTPYNYKKMLVKCHYNKATGSSGVGLRVNDGCTLSGASQLNANNEMHNHYIVDVTGGIFYGRCMGGISGEFSTATDYPPAFYWLGRPVESINKINLYSIGGTVSIPVGSKIDIWGVRA